MRNVAYKKKGALDPLASNLCFLHVQHRIKNKGLPIDGPLVSNLCFFTYVASHIKSKGLLIDGPLASNLCFYMHSVAYEKQEAPDSRSHSI
jgi:hypothetical protein